MSEIHTTLLKGRIVLEGDSQGARIVGQRIMSGPVCATITPIEDDGDATLEVWAQTWGSHAEAVAAERGRCAAVLEEMLAPLAGSEQYEERVGAYFLTEALRRVRGEG